MPFDPKMADRQIAEVKASEIPKHDQASHALIVIKFIDMSAHQRAMLLLHLVETYAALSLNASNIPSDSVAP